MGLDLVGDAGLPGRGYRRRSRLRRGGETGQGSAARSRAAPEPSPGRFHGGDPDRRGHDQRAHVPLEPLLPGPRNPRLQPTPSRSRHPAGHGRARGGRTPGPQAGGQVRWSVRGRRRIRDHRRRIRGHRPQPELVGVRGLRPAADRRRRRYGAVQRSGIVSRDRLGPGQPGRRGFGRVEHGPLRRGRRGDRPRRVHLQLGHRPADCCRCGTRGSLVRRTRHRLLGDGRLQCGRCG